MELVVLSNGSAVTLELKEDTLSVKFKGKKRDIPYRQVISAKTQDVQEARILEVYYLVKTSSKQPFILRKIDGRVGEEDKHKTVQWIASLMKTAYKDTKSCKHLRVLVNPHGGSGQALAMFTKVVEPIFRAADCKLDVTFTTHQGHAHEIAKDLSLDYDAVVTLSGDGLVHEILNGFAQHPNSAKAFDIPIAPIPTGSGNGLSLNLMGLENGLDVAAAALNVIKGLPMKTDIFAITQNGKQTLSFMSQAMGLLADLDIGTEHLRWMGDSRFVYGYLRGLVGFKNCPIQLSIKVAERDKVVMAESLQVQGTKDKLSLHPSSEESTSALPQAPKYRISEEDDWITFEQPILFLYAGQGPYVSRDFMAFPVSRQDDGVIDIVVQERSSRKECLAAMNGAVKGKPYWLRSQHYFKAHAYRVKPLSNKGYFAIDGEAFPFEEYVVEVRPGLATFLSTYGRYAEHLSVARKDVNVGR